MDVNVSAQFRAMLVSRGMAYINGDGEFTLNRKGRRFLESQAGKPAVKRLRSQAKARDKEVKQAWSEKKKLESPEKS